MKLFILTVSAVTTLLATDAALAVPPMCRTGSGARGYNEGTALQTGLLNYIWQTRFDCNTLESFIAAVTVPGLSWSSSSSSPYLDCRNAGIRDAMWSTVSARQLQCGLKCFDNGSNIGRLHGQTYCGLPPVAPTYQAPSYAVPLCTITSRQGCESALRSFVNNHCPGAVAADPQFESYVDLACPR